MRRQDRSRAGRWLALGLALFLALGIALAGTRAAATPTSATPIVGTPVASNNPDIARENVHVNFGDFTTTAQLTYPTHGVGPFPTVILIPGSGPADMDFTLVDPATGQVRSHIFLDIANFLTLHGFAVVRYNKHYVTRSNDPAEARMYSAKISMRQLLDDAGKIYDATRTLPRVDSRRISLYGWSEGSIIATQLAVAHPEVEGLILQGVVATGMKDALHYQFDLATQFLQQETDTNHDGAITLDEELTSLRTHDDSTISRDTQLIVFDPTSTLQNPKLNAFVDRNHDGKLEIATEIKPFVAAYFEEFDQINSRGGPFSMYTAANALPSVLSSIGTYRGPVLLLQGGHDANVPPDGAKQVDAALAAAGNRDHTLIVYPDLGHSLGPAPTVFQDGFAPIAHQPPRDLVAWLNRHTGQPNPRTLAASPSAAVAW